MTNSPDFRKPWTSGARGYHEADTFAAAKEGFKRHRQGKIFHMTNSGEAGQRPCVSCGIKLADPYPVNTHNDKGETKVDEYSTWHYVVAGKRVVGGQHYICSWGTLLQSIFDLADAGRI
jgi:hypothetical protein